MLEIEIRNNKNKWYLSLAIFVIIFFLVYSFILAFGSLEGSPKENTGNGFFPYLNEKPLTEDGFYMLTVAWNIAAGKGVVYNYNIKTTGIQPLAAFFYAIPAYIIQSFNGGKYLFARIVIIISALLQILFGILIYKLAIIISGNTDKSLYLLLSICIVLLNFKILLLFSSGLETVLYLNLFAGLIIYYLSLQKTNLHIKEIIILGLFTGFLILCRLDAAFILILFYLITLLNKKIKLIQFSLILLIGFVIYFPWEVYVISVTGNILQSSARSQLSFFGFWDFNYRIEQFFASIVQDLTPFLYTGVKHLSIIFVLGIPYIIFLFLLYKKNKDRLILKSLEKILKLFAMPMFLLVVIYFSFSAAPHFYFRYFSYLLLIVLPILVVLFADLLKRFNKNIFNIVLLLILASFIVEAHLYFHTGKSAVAYVVRPEFVTKNFSKETRIASFQTGLLGYYCENVFNLDGKMDNKALISFRNKSLEKYIDNLRIDVILEWKDAVPFILDSNYLNEHWKVFKDDIGDGRTICYVRIGNKVYRK